MPESQAVLWIRIRIRSIQAYVFRPPESVIICKQKSKKKLYFNYFVTSFRLFIFGDWCKSNDQKTFVGIMSATDEKSRSRIPKSVVLILGSGSLPKCHGSTKPGHKSPGFNSSIPRHSGIWGATEDAVLNLVLYKNIQNILSYRSFLH